MAQPQNTIILSEKTVANSDITPKNTANLAAALRSLAAHYNTPEFIANDPVQFPHRYLPKGYSGSEASLTHQQKCDIEVSAFLTAWISWGNRRQIIRTAQHLDADIFRSRPFDYLMSGEWAQFLGNQSCFYRTQRKNDFALLMERLKGIYLDYEDLESAVKEDADKGMNYAESLSYRFRGIQGIADARKGSPCKRLWFFLRWMVRTDHIVDLGIWRTLSPENLIIPLDTHVFHTARQLGLTARRTADIRTALEITLHLKTIFPSDPTLGDFALFGYGEEQSHTTPCKSKERQQ